MQVIDAATQCCSGMGRTVFEHGRTAELALDQIPSRANCEQGSLHRLCRSQRAGAKQVLLAYDQ
jgi:hypothetical protein